MRRRVSGRHLPTWRCFSRCPGRTSWTRLAGRKGRAARRAEEENIALERVGKRRRNGWKHLRPTRRGSPLTTMDCLRRPRNCLRLSAATSPPSLTPRSSTARSVARRGSRSSSTRPARANSSPVTHSASIYRVFLGRQNGPRAGWLLASLNDRIRRRSAERGLVVSVGLQRLRDDAETIRNGATRQGRGPAAGRRRLLPRTRSAAGCWVTSTACVRNARKSPLKSAQR